LFKQFVHWYVDVLESNIGVIYSNLIIELQQFAFRVPACAIFKYAVCNFYCNCNLILYMMCILQTNTQLQIQYNFSVTLFFSLRH